MIHKVAWPVLLEIASEAILSSCCHSPLPKILTYMVLIMLCVLERKKEKKNEPIIQVNYVLHLYST